MSDAPKSNLVKYCHHEGVIAASAFAAAIGSFMITSNTVHEDWNNEPTQLTDIANENFQNSIKKITVLQKTQDIVAEQQTIFEYNSLDSNFDLNSPQWIDYKAEEAIFKQKTENLSERLDQEKQSFFNNVMLNTDITEQDWGKLTTTFEEDTSFDLFPRASSGYALRECQLESSKQNLDSRTARAKFTNSCVKQEGESDDALPVVAGILGSFLGMATIGFLGVAATAMVANTERRKKYQKKKMN